MSFKSVNHPKAPPMKGRIRAETHIAGYIMKPSEKDPNSTDFCIVSQSDIKVVFFSKILFLNQKNREIFQKLL